MRLLQGMVQRSSEMSLHYSPTSSVARSSDGNETQVHGTWLVLARIGWLTFTLLTVGLFIAGLPTYVAYLHLINTTFPGGPQLSLGDLRTLQTHGLSLEFYAWFHIGMNLITLLVYLFVAAVIFWRKSDDLVALLASITLVVFPLMLSTPVLGPLVMPLLTDVVGFLGIVCMGLFFYLFPNGRFVPRWTGFLMFGWIGFWAIAVFFPAIPTRSDLFAVLFLCLIASQVALQVYRYRRVSTPIQRQQTKWVISGFALSFGSYALSFALLYGVLPGLFHIHLSPLGHMLGLLPSDFLLLLFPLSIGFAILRYRLWDIDIILNRTLVYVTLSLSVIGVYMLVVVGLGSLIQAQGDIVLALLATGVIAVLFQPLRERLQQGVNHLLYGERDEPYRVLARLGQRLQATLTAETVLPMIVETLAQALKLPFVAISCTPHDTPTDPTMLVAYGEPPEPFEYMRVPLISQQETVGELLLSPRQRGESLTPTDQRFLHELAPQIGVAVHAVRLTADLKQSTVDLQQARERLVTAREEERRRLRRDLHDGLGPQLSSQTLTLAAARKLLRQDPDAAEQLLADATAHAQQAIVDIRRLVYALRPPALDDLGLLAALQEQLNQYRASGVSFTLDAPEQLPQLPAAVEVACYRIVQEALTNVIRHSHAHACTIRLKVEKQLVLEIGDDGQGFPPAPHNGVGLTSMRERAEELGGTCTITTQPEAGTCVLARLPLAWQGKERLHEASPYLDCR
jgi:signal transduction histidine kinase